MDLVKGIAQPRSVEEVVALVHHARATRQPLYPISRGMNWGYGGAAPPRPGCLLVDLSGMNRIRNGDEIGPAHPVAVIEPGVTQQQLYDWLERCAPALSFNVTGAARSTSVLGNALDRGVGYWGPKAQDVFGLEVVLGTGDVLRTGFRRLDDASPLATSHPAGLGPLPDGLFFQGNFGIVTSACFRLRRKQPVELTLSMGLSDGARLGEFLDVLIGLRRDGVLTSVTHVGNADRAQVSMQASVRRYLTDRCHQAGPPLDTLTARALRVLAGTPWTGLAGLCGTRRIVRAHLAEVRARLAGLARVRAFDDAQFDRLARWTDRLRWIPPLRAPAAALAAAQPLQALALGTPTDVAFDNLIQLQGPVTLGAADYGASRCGVLFINPALPMDGAWAARFVDEMKALARAEGQALYVTLNVESPETLVAVVNLLHDREDAEASASALRLADRLLALVHARGLELYRARVDQMPAVTARSPAHWRLIKQLKDAWDPDGVMAPGRYEAMEGGSGFGSQAP